jgi:hypothetical protein
MKPKNFYSENLQDFIEEFRLDRMKPTIPHGVFIALCKVILEHPTLKEKMSIKFTEEDLKDKTVERPVETPVA